MLRSSAARTPSCEDWCASEGRDPAEIERSIGAQGDPGDSGQELVDLGVRLFTVGIGGPHYDLGRVRDWLAFRDDVNAAVTQGVG